MPAPTDQQRGADEAELAERLDLQRVRVARGLADRAVLEPGDPRSRPRRGPSAGGRRTRRSRPSSSGSAASRSTPGGSWRRRSAGRWPRARRCRRRAPPGTTSIAATSGAATQPWRGGSGRRPSRARRGARRGGPQLHARGQAHLASSAISTEGPAARDGAVQRPDRGRRGGQPAADRARLDGDRRRAQLREGRRERQQDDEPRGGRGQRAAAERQVDRDRQRDRGAAAAARGAARGACVAGDPRRQHEAERAERAHRVPVGQRLVETAAGASDGAGARRRGSGGRAARSRRRPARPPPAPARPRAAHGAAIATATTSAPR